MLKADPLTIMVIAVMIKRLGGKVIITQKDLDQIAYNRIEEFDRPAEDALELVLIERKPTQ